VYLIKIDASHVESLERSVDFMEDSLSREASGATTVDLVQALGNSVGHADARLSSWKYRVVHFGRDNETVAVKLVLLDRVADDLLGYTVAVNVRSVYRGDERRIE
jgi:hypothetical protein